MKISAEILLQQLQEAELGGFEAQKIYAPPYRSLLSEEEILANNPKYAAVNILLYPKNGEWYFPLILRTHNENDILGKSLYQVVKKMMQTKISQTPPSEKLGKK